MLRHQHHTHAHVKLTNPAPLVVHVFAVSGSDITGPPIYSAITDPGAGGTSANVTTAPITVPGNSLLLGWVKNEIGATATALDGYTLDAQSTSFLWAESQTALTLVPTRAIPVRLGHWMADGYRRPEASGHDQPRAGCL